MRVQFAHPAFHSLQHGVAVGLGDLIELVDHHQGRRGVAGRRGGIAVHGLKVGHRVQDVDNAARSYAVHATEPEHAGDGQRVGQAAGLHDDGVEPQLRVGQPGQRHVEPTVVGQAADAAAGDRRRLVDLTGDQSRIDVQFTEVVDHHADPGIGTAQHVVEQGGLPGAQISGECDDGYRLHTAPFRDSAETCCAAVDQDGLRGDERRFVAEQKRHRRTDVGGHVTEAAHRHPAQTAFIGVRRHLPPGADPV